MRGQGLGNIDETGVQNRHSATDLALANLDARKPRPYTSAVPEKDMILNPRAGLEKAGRMRGWQRITYDVAAL